MLGSKKSKRVSWAINLCQVGHHSSSEPPSKVGMGAHDHLKAKSVRPVPSGGDEPNDDVPPGFEATRPTNLWQLKPSTKWRCPPKFEVSSEWQVVAGEKSKETEAQNRRTMRVLEAIYPRPSAIPPNPSVVLEDVESSSSDDQNILVVPLTPIEDTYAAMGASFVDQRNIIDYNLLARILSNPVTVEQLITNVLSTTTQFIPNSSLPSNIAYNRTHPTPSAQTIKAPSMAAKDINYCRSLIQQYGGDQTRDNIAPESAHQLNFKDRRERVTGAYQHDTLEKRRFNGITEVQSMKRVKLRR